MSTQKIGRYEIERKLGEGGMAVVYLARDPLTKRQVAVKMLLLPSQQFEIGKQLRARFEREAEIVAALEHPHIVPIHDFGEHDPDPSGGAGGQPFIVMRYMTGGSLADRLKQHGRLSLAETAGIIHKLASALDDAHRRGVVHRDLKPANILFDGRGEPYISDFGIAKLGEAAGHLTGTGAAIGTPAYMSPEQVQGEKELDGRSDVYSLGVVIFEMLTGQTPYNADTPGKLMLKHVLEPAPRISTADPTLPAGCDAILLRALAKSHDDRYATAGDLADDLTQLAAAAVATAPTMIDPPSDAPPAQIVKEMPQATAPAASPPERAANELVELAEKHGTDDNVSVAVLAVPGGTGEIRKRLPVIAGVGGAAIVFVIAMALLFLNSGTAKPTQQAPTPYPDTGQVPIEQASDLKVFAPGATTETKNAVIIPARYLLRNGASVAVLRVFDANLYLGAQAVATLSQIQSADPGESNHVIITVDQGQVLFRSGKTTFIYTTRSNEGYDATVQAGSGGMLGVVATTGNMTMDCIIGNCEVLAVADGNKTLLVGGQRVTVTDGKASTPVALTESDSQHWWLLCGCIP